ncbi:hypothetical protein [uncultured Vibrio sp.]|uniref:hypothetical protein n=1 Tax=uncultured Vibrio sp. TaxID=114054 RepID=UPI002631531E|nr:hypothetical protein [uncultured Vibrio sp.]
MDELELIEQKIHELKKELAQLEQQKQRLLTQETINKEPVCEISPQQKGSSTFCVDLGKNKHPLNRL